MATMQAQRFDLSRESNLVGIPTSPGLLKQVFARETLIAIAAQITPRKIARMLEDTDRSPENEGRNLEVVASAITTVCPNFKAVRIIGFATDFIRGLKAALGSGSLSDPSERNLELRNSTVPARVPVRSEDGWLVRQITEILGRDNAKESGLVFETDKHGKVIGICLVGLARPGLKEHELAMLDSLDILAGRAVSGNGRTVNYSRGEVRKMRKTLRPDLVKP